MDQLQMTEVSKRLKKEGKTKFKALLFLAFGGSLGLHRFYLGMYGTGLKTLLASIYSFGLAGVYIAIEDYRNLDNYLKDSNRELHLKIVKEVARIEI